MIRVNPYILISSQSGRWCKPAGDIIYDWWIPSCCNLNTLVIDRVIFGYIYIFFYEESHLSFALLSLEYVVNHWEYYWLLVGMHE